jgi:hypothetical protein
MWVVIIQELRRGIMRSSKKRVRQGKVHALTAAPLTVASPKLTVGQIVEQLGSLAPDPAAASERIRHWTREKLLVPVDQHHAGTGRHRQYSGHASFDAAVLTALSNVGLQIVSRPYIQAALSQARAVLQEWQKGKSSGDFFLVISHRTGNEPTVSVHEKVVKPEPTAEIVIALNLSQLFSVVRRT